MTSRGRLAATACAVGGAKESKTSFLRIVKSGKRCFFVRIVLRQIGVPLCPLAARHGEQSERHERAVEAKIHRTRLVGCPEAVKP